MKTLTRRPRLVTLVLVLLVARAIAAEGWSTIGNGQGWGPLFTLGAYEAYAALAVAVILVRAVLVEHERLAWALLGLGGLSWVAGDIVYSAVLVDMEEIPFPSWADAGYLGFVPLTFAGLVTLLRGRVNRGQSTMWIDGLTAALAAAALASSFVFHEVLDTVGGSSAAVATNLAYPLGDLILIGTVIGAAALMGWRLDRTWALLGAGLLGFCVADSMYLVQSARDTYEFGTWFDPGWTTAFVLTAIAAWSPPPGPVQAVARPVSARTIALPIAFALLGLGVLVYGVLEPISDLSVVLAVLSLLAVIARLLVTFNQNQVMLLTSQREALTDSLTGLGNRRALLEALAQAAQNASPERPTYLAIFDLDGFKHYNDTFGHPAGDALLHRLGRRLSDRVDGHGDAFRMGGDEFCLLADCDDLVAAVAKELDEHGEGFAVTCSYGAIAMPTDASDAESALRLADRRMYAHKHGRGSTGQQVRDALARVTLERSGALGSHSHGVAELAERVAAALDLDAGERELTREAAELHDIGKLAVPDTILDKPGPLDDEEWAFMRTHTIIGERILGAAPALARVGAVVRASHERWDGAGYPDGLAGAEIPLPARIICACDAYDVMTTERPYHAALCPGDAIGELRRCAGTQFDPGVIDALCTICGPVPAET